MNMYIKDQEHIPWYDRPILTREGYITLREKYEATHSPEESEEMHKRWKFIDDLAQKTKSEELLNEEK